MRMPKHNMGLKFPTKATTIKQPSQQAMLPSKKAMRMLTKGDPVQQSLGNYAKLTPSGAGAVATPYNDIMNQPDQPKVIPALPTDE